MGDINAVTFSEKFNIPKCKIDELGVFNRFMDIDSNYYIERRLLSKNNFFKEADKKLNYYLKNIVKSKQNIHMYININNKCFNEACNIGLGTSSGHTSGKGTGKKSLDKLQEILTEAYDNNITGLEQLIYSSSILVDGIGRDKTSDFIANVIEPYIIKYTQHICEELNINYSDMEDRLLLPSNILVELPLDEYWTKYKGNTTFYLLNELLESKQKHSEYLESKNTKQRVNLYNQIIRANIDKDNITPRKIKNLINNAARLVSITPENINAELIKYHCRSKRDAKLLISRLTGCSISTDKDVLYIQSKMYNIEKDGSIYVISEGVQDKPIHKKRHLRHPKHKKYASNT